MNFDKILAVRTAKTVYRDGDTVLKVFNSDYSKADVLNEALNQARVEESGLSIPKVRGVETVDGKWVIVSDYIEGVTLAKLMKEHPENKSEYLRRFVELQMQMHNCKCPLLGKLRDKMDRKINETTLDATTRYELHTRLEAMPRHTKLCHGDFNPSNIIVTPEDKMYIIDWSHATQGNASADVARTYLLFWLEGDINTANEYLELFCRLSDTARQYVEKWLPIVAASQSVKGKPEEREFLLHWVNVVDYE